MVVPLPTLDPDVRPAAWSLRIGVAVQCAALAWLALRHGTAVDTLVLMDLGWPESTARRADQVLAVLALLAAAGALVRPRPSAVLAAVLFLALAICVRLVGGRAFSELAPADYATRWLAPLALLPLLPRGSSATVPLASSRRRTAEILLRVAVAATFAAHGWEALQQKPHFVDLLLGTSRRWFDTAPAESTARVALLAIGTLDLLVAAALLLARRSGLAAWAVLWGLTTALARPVGLGGEFVHEALLRSLNALAPLALWFLLRDVRTRGGTTPS